MSRDEKRETKVYVQGKLIPLKELEKEYPEMSLAGIPSNVKVIETLTKAEKPLNRKAIAERTGLSVGYTRDVLKTLTKKGYILEFQLTGRTRYYLLTEKGLGVSEEITS